MRLGVTKRTERLKAGGFYRVRPLQTFPAGKLRRERKGATIASAFFFQRLGLRALALREANENGRSFDVDAASLTLVFGNENGRSFDVDAASLTWDFW